MVNLVPCLIEGKVFGSLRTRKRTRRDSQSSSPHPIPFLTLRVLTSERVNQSGVEPLREDTTGLREV